MTHDGAAGPGLPELDLEAYLKLAQTHRFPQRDPFAESLSAAIFELVAEVARLRRELKEAHDLYEANHG